MPLAVSLPVTCWMSGETYLLPNPYNWVYFVRHCRGLYIKNSSLSLSLDVKHLSLSVFTISHIYGHLCRQSCITSKHHKPMFNSCLEAAISLARSIYFVVTLHNNQSFGSLSHQVASSCLASTTLVNYTWLNWNFLITHPGANPKCQYLTWEDKMYFVFMMFYMNSRMKC